MNYTLNQLNVFAKVVEHKSVTKASEELFMTQPAVSIQLKNFQDQFDIPLTEVVGRKLYVTDFGYEIYQIVSDIINGVNAIKLKTHDFKGELSGRLKLAVASTGKYVMPSFLSGFMNENPAVDLLMNVTNKSQVISSLQKNEVDFALVSVVPPNMNVHEVELLENRLYLFQGKDLANKKIKGDSPLIYREEGSATRLSMEKFFRDRPQGSKIIELMSNEAVKQAVIVGLGYSLMPIIGLRHELMQNEVSIVKTDGLPIRTMWRLIWLKEKKLSPLGERYVAYLNENKDCIVHDHFEWMHNY